MSAWAWVVARAGGTPEELAELSEAMLEIQNETLRRAAVLIRNANPDRSPEWSDAIDWAADMIDPEAL